MATVTTTEAKVSFLGNPTHSVPDMDTDTIKTSLLDATDSGTIDATTVDYAEINGPDPVSEGADLAGKVISAAGVFDATDYTHVAVSGHVADYLVMFKDSGSAATSPVIVVWDSATSGIPFTPNGGDAIIQWNGSGILGLV